MPRSTRGQGRKTSKTRDSATGGLARSQSKQKREHDQQNCTHGAACHFKLKCTHKHTEVEIADFKREAELELELAEIRARRQLQKIQHARNELKEKQPSSEQPQKGERVAPQTRAPVDLQSSPQVRGKEETEQEAAPTEAEGKAPRKKMSFHDHWLETFGKPEDQTVQVGTQMMTPERAARVAACTSRFTMPQTVEEEWKTVTMSDLIACASTDSD